MLPQQWFQIYENKNQQTLLKSKESEGNEI